MIEITYGVPENLIIAAGHGKVTADDYEKVLVPAVEEALRKHKKIRFLYYIDADFDGFTAGAMWDDAKLGFSHFNAFEAVAIVTDVHWVVDMVKFFSLFFRCPVKTFGNAKYDEALDWVSKVAWRNLREAA